ncbi:MAG TPA: LysR family transcriptional regulator [Kofleriaceae bacterium]|nr:LysR family transcriptional regulator [Kofleriaceae bacterium]
MATFVRIVETGSLSAAAGALRRSLPGVSRQLTRLEQELGTTLVKRSTRRLQITEAGQSWYAHCVRILSELDAARANVNAGRAARGLLTVSAPVSLGMAHVVPRIPAILRRHSGLHIDLRLEDHLVEPVTAGIDVVVRAGFDPPDSAALVAHPLLVFHRAIVAAPSYLLARGEPGDAAALTSHECLVQLGGGGPLSAWHLIHRGKEQVIQVRGALRLSAPVAIREAALAGLGIAFVPEWLVASDLADGRLRRILTTCTSRAITAWALYRAELRRSARIRAFIDECQVR